MPRCTKVRATPLWESSLCCFRRSCTIQLSGWGSLPVPFKARGGACFASPPALVVLSRKHRRHFRYLPVLIGTVTTAFRFAGLKNLCAVGKRLFLAVFCGSHEMLTSEPK